MLPLRDIDYLLASTTRTGFKLSVTRALSLFPSELQEQVPGQPDRKAQVSQIRRLSRTIERVTNDELKGLVATPVLWSLKENAFSVDQLLWQ